jgi:hypothetical protein
MVQAPAPTTETVLPDTVQTAGVVDEYLTGSPELAAAVRRNGAAPNTRLGNAGNAICCVPATTVKLWLTESGAQVEFPAWLAVTVQVPVPTIVRMVPDTVHTTGVEELNVTGRPELAVAPIVNGALPNESTEGPR